VNARRRGARRNPPIAVAVAQLRRDGVLIGSDVIDLTYYHASSAQQKPYRHQFDKNGAAIWGLPDGSLLIRHPRLRLWEDRVVGDDA
jgi:hypothetical protein